MFGLEKTADDFDKIYESSQRDMTRTLLERPGQWSGETFGPDSTFGAFLGIFPATAWSLYTFAAYSGKSLVDVLRLGEGVKSGTVAGVFQDVIRVLNLIPLVGMGAKGAGMALKGAGAATGAVTRAWAASAAGGEYAMSCGATSNVVAMRLSGQRVIMTLDEFGNALGKGSPKVPDFPGVYFEEMLPALRNVGAGANEVRLTAPSLQTIEGVAAQGKGPVVFGVQWWGAGASRATQPLGNAAVDWSAADHWLAAFKNSRGAVVVADQYGVRPIADLGKIGSTTTQFSITTRALQFENVGFAAGAEKLVAAGGNVINAGGKLTGAGSPALRSWLALSMGVEMVVVSKPTADRIDGAVREELGLPPRGGAAPASNTGSDAGPNALPPAVSPGGAPVSERDYIRSLLGPINSRTPADEIFSRLVTAGYSRGRVTTVLEEMQRALEIDLVRGPVGTITYVIRRRMP